MPKVFSKVVWWTPHPNQSWYIVYSSYKQQQAKKEQKSAPYLTSHLRLANQKPPKSLGVRKKRVQPDSSTQKVCHFHPYHRGAFLDEHEITCTPTSYSWIVERIPEMESWFCFLQVFDVFCCSRFWPRTKINAWYPSNSSMSSHRSARIELRRQTACRTGWNNLTQSLRKLAKKKTFYSLVSCWGLTWKSCWHFDWKNGGQLGMDKSHEHRPRNASCVSINKFSTPKPQLHVQAYCRCSKTLATLACVNGAKQFQIQEWITFQFTLR